MKLIAVEKIKKELPLFGVTFGLISLLVVDSKAWGLNVGVKWFGVVIAVLFLAVYFYQRNLKADTKIVKLELTWSVVFCLTSIFGSWIMSDDPRQGIARVSWILAYFLFFHIILDLFDAGVNKKAVINAFLIVSGAVLFFALIETYANYYVWWMKVGSFFIFPPYAYRFVSIIGHSNSLMGFTNLLAPLAIYYFFTAKGIKSKIPYAIWVICYGMAIPFSSSRGGWLGVFVWIGIVLGYWVWQKNPFQWWKALPGKKKNIFLLLFFVCLFGGLFFGAALLSKFASHPSHGGNLLGGRGEIWGNALKVWRNHFWFGAGPGRVGLAMLTVAESIPPKFWALHAHSMPIQILAEFGLMGGVALIVFLIDMSKWILNRFRLMSDSQKQFGILLLAGLLGWLAQMIVDDQTAVVTVMITVFTLFAMLITLPEEKISRWFHIKNSILMIPACILLLGAFGTMLAYHPFSKALANFNGENYDLGSTQLDISIERDPNYSFYKSQAGFLYAIAADATNLERYYIKAHDEFLSSLAIEPDVSPLYANLAVINWQTDRFHGNTISNMEKAIELSPNEASYYLNMGWFYEQSNKLEQAKIAYKKVLELQPNWAAHPFWKLTTTRKEVVIDWLETYKVPKGNSDLYWAKARQAISQNQFEEAELLLAKAGWAGESSIAIDVTSGLLAKAKGNEAGIIQSYEKVAEQIIPRKFTSVHQFMMTYTIWMNNRMGYTDDFVPGYLSLTDDVGQFEAMSELYSIYLSRNDCENASRIWEIFQTAMHGNALEPFSDMPACLQ